jgi:hypothetical protein
MRLRSLPSLPPASRPVEAHLYIRPGRPGALFGDDDFVLAGEVAFGFAAICACRLDAPWPMQQKDGVRVLLNLSGLAQVV